jgi:chemotaxis signal transduction protein
MLAFSGEFLSFRLGGEEYGIDIQKAQELRGYDSVSNVITLGAEQIKPPPAQGEAS